MHALEGKDFGQAKDGLEVARQGEELWPDLIVLDIGLPTLHGIEAPRLIRRASPNSKISFLTMESSAEVIEKASSGGARGYVRKTGQGTSYCHLWMLSSLSEATWLTTGP